MIKTEFMKLYEELSEINDSLDLKTIVDIVAAEVEKYDENGSNQNCLFSTWAVELQLRGEDFLPRPVYSPRDPIFDIKGEELVIEPEVLKISSKEDVEAQVLEAGDSARFYCHVNWAGSKGGHEFLLINDNGSVLVVDGQVGYIEDIQNDNTYFEDINFENSYIVRLDNKGINQDILRYNNEDQIVEWDDEIDTKLLESVGENTLSIEGVSSPEELMDWMDENITYELANDDYGAENDPLTKTAQEVLKTGTGHCAEQSYLEKEILDNLGYETFLVMVKENNSKKEYGAEGSAHVFLVYKEGKNYCWFEHSMQHARGIHKYTSLEALLQDVANQWWRYDKNSDILEVRMMDKVITGVDTWGLAKECYKLPVKYTFDISDNIMESDVPLEEDLDRSNVQENIPYVLNKKFSADQVDAWVQQHYGSKTPTEGSIYIAPNGTFIDAGDDHADIVFALAKNNFIKKSANYNSFEDEDGYVFVDGEVLAVLLGYVRCNTSVGDWAYISLPSGAITSAQGWSLVDWLDAHIYTNKALRSIEVNTDNCSHKYLLSEYTSEEIVQKIKRYYASGRLYESLQQIDYLPVSDIELFKEYADDILGGYGDISDVEIKSSIKEIHFAGKLAGYIGFSEYEEDGHKCLGIGNFMIIERGKGLGSAVIQNIVERYKNQYDLIYCFVDAKNDGAIRLYKKLGKVYDEYGPNDNGEYYVTFWDNGKWELDEEFDPPYNEQQIRDNYGEETYQRLRKDPAHLWRMRTGIELIHREPSKEELERIWANWQLMNDKQKHISDKKSKELFGKTNAEHYTELINTYS